jgi:hypothetical protein
MSELEQILRWLKDQMVPADDTTFVNGTLLRIEQQLEIPKDALERARALKKRIEADVGLDLFNVGVSLKDTFSSIQAKRNAKQLSDANWAFAQQCWATFSKGSILDAKDVERLFKLAE